MSSETRRMPTGSKALKQKSGIKQQKNALTIHNGIIDFCGIVPFKHILFIMATNYENCPRENETTTQSEL